MADQSQARLRLLLVVLCLGPFMAGLDLFIVNVAFNAISQDFHGQGLDNLSWVLNGYAIVFAALLVPLGRLADRYGRKAGFVLGVVLFSLASQGCALAPSLWALVAFRVVQAVGAAALIPASLGILLAAFPAHQRAAAVRVWSASSALAAAAGPAVGGLLVEVSWRWVFEVNLPIGAVTAVAAIWLVPGSRERVTGRFPDLFGAIVLTAAVGLLSLGLVKINDWPGSRTAVVLAVAVVALAGFWLRSLRHSEPMLDPALLRAKTFAWANGVALLFMTGFAANLLLGVLWMQEVWGYSAIRTGLGVVVGPLMVPLFAAVAGRLIARIGPGLVTALGCLMCAAGVVVVIVSIGPVSQYATEFLPGWIIYGAGVGLALPTILAASADLPPLRFATGSALINMSRQVGSVLGVSFVVLVLGTPRGYPDVHHAYVRTWVVVTAFMVAAALAAPPMTARRSRPAMVTEELVTEKLATEEAATEEAATEELVTDNEELATEAAATKELEQAEGLAQSADQANIVG